MFIKEHYLFFVYYKKLISNKKYVYSVFEKEGGYRPERE